MLNIKTVSIIGANGTMGSLISAIIAGFGDCKVYLISRNKQNSIDVINKAKKSIRSDIIEKNLIPIDYTQLKDAVQESDWIFESIIEDYDAKSKIYKEINLYNINHAIISTGTSGLSINKLAENFSEENKKRFLGMHFFNPPYSLNLCEIIPSKYTDSALIENLRKYLENILIRNTIIVKDEPAFLANRIGFEFLNEVLQLAEKYKDKGGIDYIDSLFSGYTGRTMKPLETIDFVGLDVHKAIVDNIYNNTNDEFTEKFICPNFLIKLIELGKLGKKTKEGLYRKVVKDGIEENQVYDINTGEYRKIKKYENNTINEIINLIKLAKYEQAYKILIENTDEDLQLVVKLLTTYIVYSLIMSSKYAESLNDCDKAMEFGFNWCPPIAMKELIKEVGAINKIVNKYIDSKIIEKYNVYDLIQKSNTIYDYRKFLKATY